jgi:hypothetical protein
MVLMAAIGFGALVAACDDDGATNPTNEALCTQGLQAYCQRAVNCGMACQTGGPAMTTVGECSACIGIADQCTTADKSPASDAEVSKLASCKSDLSTAACADIAAGVMPTTCQAPE